MYIVIEIQNDNGEVSTIVTSYASKNEAESKFYQIMAAAAISSLEKHSASILTDDGNCYMTASYEH